MTSIGIEPGEFMSRAERKAAFGGATRGGIEPSTSSPHVFIYTDPLAGLAHGYNFDGWSSDGSIFFYTGEGQSGAQVLTHRNGSILNHLRQQRNLHLFSAEGTVGATAAKNQRYIGEFAIDPEVPFDWAEAPDSSGEVRPVVVFRLRPMGRPFRRTREQSQNPIATATEMEELLPLNGTLDDIVDLVQLERMLAPAYLHEDESKLRLSMRREAALVKAFTNYLRDLGHEVSRHKITPQGSPFPLFTDVFDNETQTLYEAKAGSDRDQVRMVVGQLFDYRRYMKKPISLASLLPTRPKADLTAFLAGLDVGLSHPSGKGFVLPLASAKSGRG